MRARCHDRRHRRFGQAARRQGLGLLPLPPRAPCPWDQVTNRVTRRGRQRPLQAAQGGVETSFAWLARFSCPSISYKRRADLHLAFTALACVVICLWQIRRFDP